MIKEKLLKLRDLFFNIVERASEANINGVAIIISYYSLLAILPTVIFLGNLIPLLNIHVQDILDFLKTLVPVNIYPTLKHIINSFLKRGSGSLASISAILAIWAVSRAINTLQRGFNLAYGVGKRQGAFFSRMFAIILTLIIGFLIASLFILFSFGQIALDYLTPIFNLSTDWMEIFLKWKFPTVFLGIFISLVIAYRVIPNVKTHFILVIPGAIVATIGWIVLSQGFSIYVTYFARSIMSYEALGTFIVLLLWLNYTGWVIMLGVVLNAGLEYYFYQGVEEKTRRLHRIYLKTNKKENKKGLE